MADPSGSGDVVVRALAAACSDPDVLARLGGGLGAAVRAVRDEPFDRTAQTRWAMAARTPVPAGLRGVHPSWVEAGLAGLPVRARDAVAAGGGAGSTGAVDTWLARWAMAGVPPMLPVSAPRVTTIESVVCVDAATLTQWIEDAGADQLALSVSVVGGDVAVAMARVVGARLVAAAARIAVAPRRGALGPVRAAIARCRVELDGQALLRIGARAIAPYLEPLARLRIMHRLPRPLGIVVGDELAGAARAALADAPRWAALTAA